MRPGVRELRARILEHLRKLPDDHEGEAIIEIEQALREMRLEGHIVRMQREGMLIVERRTWPNTTRARDLYRVAPAPAEKKT
jgi:hypothetical protein